MVISLRRSPSAKPSAASQARIAEEASPVCEADEDAQDCEGDDEGDEEEESDEEAFPVAMPGADQ